MFGYFTTLCMKGLSDCNGIWAHNHLGRKRTLNHVDKLASLAKCLSVSFQIKWL